MSWYYLLVFIAALLIVLHAKAAIHRYLRKW
jgi:hypothetical protein